MGGASARLRVPGECPRQDIPRPYRRRRVFVLSGNARSTRDSFRRTFNFFLLARYFSGGVFVAVSFYYLSFEATNGVDRGDDDDANQEDYLDSIEVANELLDSGCKGETQAGEQRDPGGTACQSKKRESEVTEMSQSPENCAGSSQAVDILDYENR